jgi:hypothetical protein
MLSSRPGLGLLPLHRLLKIDHMEVSSREDKLSSLSALQYDSNQGNAVLKVRHGAKTLQPSSPSLGCALAQ